MKICSLFSGIGGFELALGSMGHEPVMFCEKDDLARAVLQKRFGGVEVQHDIRQLECLPSCDIVTAGWPCQDLSQAGRLLGMSGSRSSLVTEVFRLLRTSKDRPKFVLLENVAFSLHVASGSVIEFIAEQFEGLGYNWCYRILDAQYFGRPQRRRRLYVMAELGGDPGRVLFRDFEPMSAPISRRTRHFGFYWTEGNTGLGWSEESIPPIKGGSGLSIPSPPAVWDKEERNFIVPGIEDLERLQGFPAGWTSLGKSGSRLDQRKRWTQIGNAVSVPVVKWIAKGIERKSQSCIVIDESSRRQANAGYGRPGAKSVHFRTLTEGPVVGFRSLTEFGLIDPQPLSERAASGFLGRIANSSLRVMPAFVRDLENYVRA